LPTTAGIGGPVLLLIGVGWWKQDILKEQYQWRLRIGADRMKKLGHVALLLTLAFSPAVKAQLAASTRPTSVPPRTGLTVATRGEPTGLRLERTMLTFCDKRGGRQLDLTTGREATFERDCAENDEPNITCGDLSLDIEVQSPLSQPNDVLDIAGRPVRLKGRVHDCAADGKVLAVVTGSTVVLVDTTRRTTKEISRKGGDRVTIGTGWVAWSNGAQLRAAAR
jgi:hypothetical protein